MRAAERTHIAGLVPARRAHEINQLRVISPLFRTILVRVAGIIALIKCMSGGFAALMVPKAERLRNDGATAG
jgi:hypothetical protein